MEMKLDCNGLWWIPGSRKIFGSLTFDENEGGILSVHGSFPQKLAVYEMFPEFPIILGETEDGQLITLQNCKLTRSEPYMNFLRKSTLKIDVIYIGQYR